MGPTVMILIMATVLTSAILTGSQIAAASDQAIVKIESNTKWSGSVLDSSFDSTTKDGKGNSSFLIACTSYGMYSLAFQKQTATGILTISVIQNNQTLDSKSTTAAYGMVTLAGNCG